MDVGTHHRRRPLGPEGQAPAALVLELVHLLADDVGPLADPLEDLDVLVGRGHHQAVAEAGGPAGELGDERGPPPRLRGQDVVRADGGAVGVSARLPGGFLHGPPCYRRVVIAPPPRTSASPARASRSRDSKGPVRGNSASGSGRVSVAGTSVGGDVWVAGRTKVAGRSGGVVTGVVGGGAGGAGVL